MAEDPGLRSTRQLWDAFNERNVDALKELVADDFENEAALPGTPPGSRGLAQLWARIWTAFPDARFQMELLARDADVTICIGTMEGTHLGDLMGYPATGRKVVWQQCHLVRVDAEGRAVHHRAIRDDLDLLRQMGLPPQL